MRVKAQMIELLEKASKAYYEGEPIMADDQFDRLAEAHGWGNVGYAQEGERCYHKYRMYSLQKHFSDDGAEHPLFTYAGTTIATPKLDGVSISLRYERGVLTLLYPEQFRIYTKTFKSRERLSLPKQYPMLVTMLQVL